MPDKDDVYKNAAQAVTDEAMRIDNLAPNMVNVLKNDVRFRNEIKDAVVETLTEKKEAKEAVDSLINSNRSTKTANIVGHFIARSRVNRFRFLDGRAIIKI